jgi:hypothetical protein
VGDENDALLAMCEMGKVGFLSFQALRRTRTRSLSLTIGGLFGHSMSPKFPSPLTSFGLLQSVVDSGTCEEPLAARNCVFFAQVKLKPGIINIYTIPAREGAASHFRLGSSMIEQMDSVAVCRYFDTIFSKL